MSLPAVTDPEARQQDLTRAWIDAMKAALAARVQCDFWEARLREIEDEVRAGGRRPSETIMGRS